MMDTIIKAPIRRYRLHVATVNPMIHLYLLTNVFHVMTTVISFFLSYYFVTHLHFSILQAGILLSFYGVGIMLANGSYHYSHLRYSSQTILKTALLLNAFCFANFLYTTSFLSISLNTLLLSFSSCLFKSANQQQLRHYCTNRLNNEAKTFYYLYISSNLGLLFAFAVLLLSWPFSFNSMMISALCLNLLPLFYLRTSSFKPMPQKRAVTAEPMRYSFSTLFHLTLLFIGGLLLAQTTTTYCLYLTDQFPALGLRAFIFFMIINMIAMQYVQRPILYLGNRFDKSLRAGAGIFLLGISAYVMSVAHAFSLVILSALLYSLGEMLFITMMQPLCNAYVFNLKAARFHGFDTILTVSFIVGASLGAYIYHLFGATTLWLSCAYLGIVGFIAVSVYTLCASHLHLTKT